jgi:phosphoribosylanthranilate isomerase
MPGGNNKSWDWSSFENPNNLPFMISGGLNITNIKKAIDLTGANFVDINSGVEDKPGIKNISLIEDLVLSLK